VKRPHEILVLSNLHTAAKELSMNNLTPDQQAMLVTWQQHTHAEFVLKDPDAALATMTENPYVFCIPTGTYAAGRAGVREFYAQIPARHPARFGTHLYIANFRGRSDR
jgi:hypothetical protein